MQFLTSQSYNRRPVPTPTTDLPGWASKLAAWLGLEFATVQRSLTRASSRSVTAATTATPTDGLIVCNATGGAFAVTLPAASTVPDMVVTIVRVNAGVNAVTITGTVSGTVNPTLASQYSSMTVWAFAPAGAAAFWYKIAST